MRVRCSHFPNEQRQYGSLVAAFTSERSAARRLAADLMRSCSVPVSAPGVVAAPCGERAATAARAAASACPGRTCAGRTGGRCGGAGVAVAVGNAFAGAGGPPAVQYTANSRIGC